MRIVLAEDAALLREGLRSLLERAGHTVRAVESADALDDAVPTLMRAGELDLVLTDVRMPPHHGDDGLRSAVKLRGAFPALPLIVLSQYVTKEYAARLLDFAPDAARPPSGIGYLLKDRVMHVHDFLRALDTVRAGGVVVDPEVIRTLVERERDRLAPLGAREREVLALVAEGATNQQIADQLFLSEGAIVKYVSAIFTKLGLSEATGNRRVMAALAYLGAG